MSVKSDNKVFISDIKRMLERIYTSRPKISVDLVDILSLRCKFASTCILCNKKADLNLAEDCDSNYHPPELLAAKINRRATDTMLDYCV